MAKSQTRQHRSRASRLALSPGQPRVNVAAPPAKPLTKSASDRQIARLEHRVAERTEKLTDANERLHAVMDTAVVGILTLDQRGIVVALNPAAARIFGYSPEELVGRNVSRLMASPDQAQHEDFLAHFLHARDTQVMGVRNEVLGRRRDGHTSPGRILRPTLAFRAHHLAESHGSGV